METIQYKGYTIEIWNDEAPINPFEDWDGCVPLKYKSGHGGKDYSEGQINDYLSGFLTDNQIIRHQKALQEIFVEINLEYYKEYELSVEDKVQEIRYIIERSNDFKELEQFCEMFNIPHLRTSKSGYSQGDWANLFICFTPEFIEVTGCTELSPEMMESGANLWSYWAYGDVYGFTIQETEDSCGGYYGDDHKKSSLIGDAESSIDAHIAYERKQKMNKLKELIKAKVPMLYRPKILNQFNTLNYGI